MTQVSVVIPIYNVGGFIRRCAETLMSQTMADGVEYIFVDDASTDNSMEVLEEVLQAHPERLASIRTVAHTENRGLPSARNTGLQHATGKYIFHCDSDDYLEPDALEQMVSAAEAGNADIVWCDWYLSFERKERYMRQPAYTGPDEALRGMLHGRMKYNVWNKLVRRDLYTRNGIRFPDGHGMGEDMTMIQLFACASAVAYLPKGLYHYIKTNSTAFTGSFSEKHLADLRHNVDTTLSFLSQRRGNQFQHDAACFLLSVKYPFLISGDRAMYAMWQEWYPEANAYIGRNRDCSLRSRILQYVARSRQFWLLWLHYHLVHRLIYGIVYR